MIQRVYLTSMLQYLTVPLQSFRYCDSLQSRLFVSQLVELQSIWYKVFKEELHCEAALSTDGADMTTSRTLDGTAFCRQGVPIARIAAIDMINTLEGVTH